MKNEVLRKGVLEYSLITLGSILYGIGTVLFVFPSGALLGGTTGIAMILSGYLPLTSGNVSVILNVSLIVIAFVFLGKSMAIKTFIGSALTTFFIGVFEPLFISIAPVIGNPYFSALFGAAIIAFASGIMFYVDSSSGGTDIVALILKKYVKINIGVALMITDVLIVVVGGILAASVTVFFSSVLGFLVKVLGIDLVISLIKKLGAAKNKNG